MKNFLSNALIPVIGLLIIAGIVVFRLIFTPVSIESGSMEPTLPVGTIAFIQPSESLTPGDIITFQQDGTPRPTTHTFIGYAEDGSLETKGDANLSPDVYMTPLQHADVLGKVMFVFPFLTAAYWVSVKGVLSLIIVALMAISIIVVLVKNRNKEGLPSDTVPEETRELTPA